MKILLIHIYFTKKYSSGINPIVFNTYETLRKQGHEVYVFALDEKPYYDEDYNYTKYFPKSNAFWHEDRTILSDIKYFINSIYNIEAQRKLAKMLDEIQPDLVHIHSTWELSYSILKPIRDRKIPIVHTEHDMALFCPAIFQVGKDFCTDCKGYNTIPCFLKKCVKGRFIDSLYISFKAFIERLLGVQRNIDKYLTVSQASKNHMIKMGIGENKITVLPNFISDSLLNIAEPNYSNENYFLYAGGTLKGKGIYTLIEAVKILPKEIEIHVAGICKHQDVIKQIKNNNLDNIKILGHLSKDQMQEEYKNCISVIMPSEWFETFGMINIEAAIYGKPSISSNIGGLPDVVEDGKTGLIFEPKNVEQLKECILKYWNNRDLAIEHGKAAREKTLKEYNEDLYFEKLIKIYEEVINNAK